MKNIDELQSLMDQYSKEAREEIFSKAIPATSMQGIIEEIKVIKKPTLSDEVRHLEEKVKKLEKEISELRSTMEVNFCDYDSRQKDLPYRIWGSIEEFQEESLLSACFKAFSFFHEQITKSE